MRELINCIAATAAWTEYCTANRLVDSPRLRSSYRSKVILEGDAYPMARCMAMTLELMIQEQARREQPRIIPFNGRA